MSDPGSAIVLDTTNVTTSRTRPVVASGVVKNASTGQPIAGAKMNLELLTDGKWGVAATTVTDNNGRFSMSTLVKDNTNLNVRVLSTPGVCAESRQFLFVRVIATASLKSSVTSAKLADAKSIPFTLETPDAGTGARGVLQIFNGRDWTIVDGKPVGSQGTASLSYRFRTRGTFRVAGLLTRTTETDAAITNELKIQIV